VGLTLNGASPGGVDLKTDVLSLTIQ